MKVPTPEQKAKIEKLPKVRKIRQNSIGLSRMNEERRKKGQPELPVSQAATPEDEIETNLSSESDSKSADAAGALALPSQVDNSLLPSFPPIGRQKFQDCVAFATTYYQASHEMGLLNGVNNKVSSQGIYSPKWTYNLINYGQNTGTYYTDALDVLNTLGAPSIVDYPYDANYSSWALTAAPWISALDARFNPPTTIYSRTPSGIDSMKAALNNGHILNVGTFYYSWQWGVIAKAPGSDASNDAYVGKKIVYAVSATQDNSGHDVTIIGYNDNLWLDINKNGVVDPGEKGAFKIANSWGPTWNDLGFVWVSYDAFLANSAVPGFTMAGGRSHFANLFDVVTLTLPKAKSYKPKLVAQFTVSSLNRGNLILQAGVSPATQTSPTSYFSPSALSYNGGSLKFDGTAVNTTLQSATLAMDLTDLAPTGAANGQRFYISGQGGGAGSKIDSFQLIDVAHGNAVISKTNNIPLTLTNTALATGWIDYSYTVTPPADITAPTVSVTAPVAQTTVSGTVPWTVNASDNVGVTKVEFYVDSKLFITLNSGPYTTLLNTVALADGPHSLSATAYDAANNKAASAAVAINVNNVPCIRANPVLSLTPASQTGTVGGDVTYTINITNQDNSVCTASVFNLSSVVPTGITSVLGQNSISLTPAASGTTTLKVTSSSTTVAGTVNVTVNATNSGATQYVGTATGTYAVTNPVGMVLKLSTDKPLYVRGSASFDAKLNINTVLNGAPLPNVPIVATLIYPNGTRGTLSRSTDAAGFKWFSETISMSSQVGTYTFTVTGTYNGAATTSSVTFVVQ